LQANISNFEIFHIQEKQVPVDIVELKEQVSDWYVLGHVTV